MKFDMELFLSGVLDGSHTTRKRHLRQANLIQNAIYQSWMIDTPLAMEAKTLNLVHSHKTKKSQHAQHLLLRTNNKHNSEKIKQGPNMGVLCPRQT